MNSLFKRRVRHVVFVVALAPSNAEDGDYCDDDEDVDSGIMIALKMMMIKEKVDEKRKDKKTYNCSMI